jgi:hypothetical protein
LADAQMLAYWRCRSPQTLCTCHSNSPVMGDRKLIVVQKFWKLLSLQR